VNEPLVPLQVTLPLETLNGGNVVVVEVDVLVEVVEVDVLVEVVEVLVVDVEVLVDVLVEVVVVDVGVGHAVGAFNEPPADTVQ